MFIGYARVSTDDQNLDLQRDALLKAGCEKIFEDVASGVKTDRPGLAQALDYMRKGDVLVVWKLDRLGRSLVDLVATVNRLNEDEKSFKCLDMSFDTTTPQGTLIFQMFAALAEFERNLIRERTMAGLTAARARGRLGGRKPIMTPDDIKFARVLMEDVTIPLREIATKFGVSIKTLRRSVARVDSDLLQRKPGRKST